MWRKKKNMLFFFFLSGCDLVGASWNTSPVRALRCGVGRVQNVPSSESLQEKSALLRGKKRGHGFITPSQRWSVTSSLLANLQSNRPALKPILVLKVKVTAWMAEIPKLKWDDKSRRKLSYISSLFSVLFSPIWWNALMTLPKTF